MRLSQLLASLPPGVLAEPLKLAADPEITGITADSRQVSPGSVFVAIPGETLDGRRFIPQAIAQGAAAIVSEEHLPHSHLPMIAGTASVGTPTLPHASTPPHLHTSTPPHALAYLSAAFHHFPARQLI